jgi:hypothetical protein
LIHRRLVQEIALLNIDAVDASAGERAESDSQENSLKYGRQSGAQPLND